MKKSCRDEVHETQCQLEHRLKHYLVPCYYGRRKPIESIPFAALIETFECLRRFSDKHKVVLCF
jgi:hypothetical protein